ncbi:carcinoembryonic antigen-related cell adhesion molecule 5-like [Acipenser oxyrinchus oxyrinchus]|uniref:Carcinoembryonic antigen-related cell adhesion molecule 5-like n=1 Tax=Acipenser oxyrinchus oxyrinchus TaxID=40147 RepID=A0AAD8CIJ5_ACIOX|nr:carcinoembryonic antigen-related cell adhesion molecule 5-like [Acipenser oxyrinchus oxyrinchus]
MGAHFINWVIISLCAGCLGLELTPVTDPVISEVGDNAMLEIKPPGVLGAVAWFFSPAAIPVVSWTETNPVIGAGYENRVTLNTATGSMELRSVHLSDAGVYTFQGNSFTSGREPFNGSVTLEVYEPITNVNVKPSLAQPIANQALNLTCEVLGSQTVSSRLWLKDDGPEQVSITGPDQEVLNSSVTFTCSAKSLPPCNYTWYFNETETAQSSQYNIASVSYANSGSYTCVAWNSVTERKSSAVKEFTVTGEFIGFVSKYFL